MSQKTMNSFIFSGKKWSERRDLNPRPLHPQCSALPGCATLRLRGDYMYVLEKYQAFKAIDNIC